MQEESEADTVRRSLRAGSGSRKAGNGGGGVGEGVRGGRRGAERGSDWLGMVGYNQTSRGVAQSGSASALGAEGRGFESLRPDHSKPLIYQAILTISIAHLLFTATSLRAKLRRSALRGYIAGKSNRFFAGVPHDFVKRRFPQIVAGETCREAKRGDCSNRPLRSIRNSKVQRARAYDMHHSSCGSLCQVPSDFF